MCVALMLHIFIHGNNKAEHVQDQEPLSERQINRISPRSKYEVLYHRNKADDCQGYEEEHAVAEYGRAHVPPKLFAFVRSASFRPTWEEEGKEFLAHEEADVAAASGWVLSLPLLFFGLHFHELVVGGATFLKLVIVVIIVLILIGLSLQVIDRTLPIRYLEGHDATRCRGLTAQRTGIHFSTIYFVKCHFVKYYKLRIHSIILTSTDF